MILRVYVMYMWHFPDPNIDFCQKTYVRENVQMVNFNGWFSFVFLSTFSLQSNHGPMRSRKVHHYHVCWMV